MDNYHSVLIVADEAPIRGDLFGNGFGFDVSNDITDVPLKRFGFEMFFSERAKHIHAEYDFAAIFVKHKRERIELAVEGSDRVDGATACFWLKKWADIEVVMLFELDLRAFSVCLRTKT